MSIGIETNRYNVEEIRTIKDLKDIYLNHSVSDAWLFLSTEGEHGTKLTLDDLEIILRDEHNLTESVNGRYWVTALIIFPKRVYGNFLSFGEIMIDEDDVAWLRDKVRETLVEVEVSQYGNT